MVPLLVAGAIQEPAYRYLTRLSDYLFTAARHVNFKADIAEHKYRPTAKTGGSGA